ncbi:hypothetical protein [Citricoccus sp. I39-566]|uniref:nuclease-related domain-containing protein n=1 Tax=Citricoccus sp. I39-566 TaxID=3073268 RepID=UPI00286CAC0A|nr:hypothetical protein [Citricoccus sp. I39-566]WMY78496.1 hypothetical protein RE421_01140 [Citricoccus sp. I39-566]
MTERWILWFVIAVLLVAVVVMSMLFVRRLRVMDRTAAVRTRERDQHFAELTEQHSREREHTVEEHRRQLAALEEEHQGAVQRADAFRLAASPPIKEDLVSRALILDSCRSLGLHGVLATNVQFLAAGGHPDKPFVAQLDHVLLTDSFAMIIENKYWKQLVFDGRLPSTVSPAFGPILDEKPLEKSFAVQVCTGRRRDQNRPSSNSDEDELLVRTHTNDSSPRSQVRRHAVQLKDRLVADDIRRPWFWTCVLYSHPRVELHVEPQPPVPEGKATRVLSGAAALRSHL